MIDALALARIERKAARDERALRASAAGSSTGFFSVVGQM